jgi:WD40 repeat protein
MVLTYDRRVFWAQAGVIAILLGLCVFVPSQGGWRQVIWFGGTLGMTFPMFVLNLFGAVALPTYTLYREARQVAAGMAPSLSEAARAQRAKHWRSPLPLSAWLVVVTFSLIPILGWTDLIPRIGFGYRGTLGQGTYVAWRQEVSPDGRWIALDASPLSARDAHSLSLVASDSGKTTVFPLAGPPRHMAWSPDSQWVAILQDGSIRMLNLAQGRLEDPRLPKASTFSFHPDGHLWLLAEAGLFRWDPRSGIAELLLDESSAKICVKGYLHEPHALALSGDGRQAALTYGPQVRILDTSSLRDVALWEPPVQVDDDLRFGPVGKVLMATHGAVSQSPELLVLDALQGRELARIGGLKWGSNTLGDVHLSQDGKWLTALRSDQTVGVASLGDGRWAWAAPIPGPTGDRCPRFSPDGGDLTTVGFTESFLFWPTGRCVRRWHWRPTT